MRAVNLLPADAYAAKQKLPYAPVVLAATVPLLAGALVYLGHSLEQAKVSDKRIELSGVQSQVLALSPSQALVSEAARVLDEKSKRQLELSDVLGKQMPWDVALGQIARVLPSNAWLTGLTAVSPYPLTGAVGAKAPCTITGYTFTQADVATVLARLTLVPSLSAVQLTQSSATLIGTKPIVQFTITANVTGTAP